MALNNTDILFASLVGSKVAESIPRFKTIQNELSKHVLPQIPIPFLSHKNKIRQSRGKNIEAEINTSDPFPANQQFFPFSFSMDDGKNTETSNKKDTHKYLLPYEPIISISGKNTIIRRQIAKAVHPKDGTQLGGQIKERLTQDDYEITITGVLIGSIMTGSTDQCYPRDDFEKLRTFMTSQKSLKVYCEPLQLLGINQIVIEDFSFPFTKGENVQAYEIKAYSDFDYKLFIGEKD